MTSSLRSMLLALVSALTVAIPLGLAVPASAQTKLKLVLNWKYQGPQGMFFLADDRGYFKAEGLDVTIDQGSGSGAAVPLVANGTYDVGFGDINALIELAAKKPDDAPIAVYVMFNQPPFTVAVKGFLKALNHGIKDAIADPKAAVDAVAAREPLIKPEIERAKFEATLAEEMSHPEIGKIGLGDISDERMGKAIEILVKAKELPRIPTVGEVFDRSFLPPAADRPTSVRAAM